MLTLKIIGVMKGMLKFFKAQIFLAVFFLVSSSGIFASEGVINLDVKDSDVVEEKWVLPVGSKEVRYGTKYTIMLNGETHEYYLEYKEVIADTNFKGYYWRMCNTKDLEKDEKFIYQKDKVKFTRNDVIKFLEIKDEKLAALIKEGYEFSLYVEPYYNYKKGKWSKSYTATLRELYSMLGEANGEKSAYEDAKDENGKIIKNKIQGIEFLREMIVKAMNSIEAKNVNTYEAFKNKYKDIIKEEMLNKGWTAQFFEEEIKEEEEKDEIKTGEFIKMIVSCRWTPDLSQELPEGVHWATPYAKLGNMFILDESAYTYSRYETPITREEAVELIWRMFKIMKPGVKADKTEKYLKEYADENLITNRYRREYFNACLEYGLINAFEDKTVRPKETLTKEEATDLLTRLVSK